MNKIEQVIINTSSGQLQFIVTSDTQVITDSLTICVDEACNKDNIHLDDTTKHNYVINSGITITNIEDNKYKVLVDNDIIGSFTKHIKYIRVTVLDSTSTEDNENYIVAEGLYYNPLVIYEAEIYNINKYCSTCLDDKNMQLIAYVTFKRQLLEDAVILRHYKEALQLYSDICRLLGMTCNYIQVNEQTNTCVGGSCPIC